MKKIPQITLLTCLLIGFTNIHADDLSGDQILGLCMVAAGNIAEGTIQGLNDKDSIKKAKVIKKAIALINKSQGGDPKKIFPSEREFNVTNNYFMQSKPSDQKNMFALCYTGLPPDLVAQLYKEIGN
jgi:hypothetical protein